MNKEILKEIGLTEYESEIYLALLQYGQISAYELAEKTGLYRQATYDALNRLIEKGYVSSSKEGRVQLYKAIDPQLILEYLNEKTESFKDILPGLIKLNEESKQPLVVETYRGKNVLRISFKDIINVLKKFGGENLCTSVDEFFPFETFPASRKKTIYDQYGRDLLKNGFKERVIIKKGVKKMFRRGTTRYRYVSEKYFNVNPVQVYGDSVQIFLWGNPDHLIIIRNKDIADSFRKQFELIWRAANLL